MPNAAAAAFSPEAELTPLEIALIGEVEAARTFRPLPGELVGDDAYVRGELIRAMMLGTPLPGHPKRRAAKARAVAVTAHGIRIVPQPSESGPLPLRIAGQLDLLGLTAPDGGFLPPLEFDHCRFDQPLKLDGARLQALAVRNSRFSSLSAKGAQFNRDVTVVGCRPRSDPRDSAERAFARWLLGANRMESALPFEDDYCSFRPSWLGPPEEAESCPCRLCEPEGAGPQDNCSLCCVLDFNSAAVAGSLRMWRSYLRAPKMVGRDYSTPLIRDAIAVEMRGAQVRDSVSLVETVTIGRISAASAEVGDDFWVWGGKFVASAERPTFDLQLATVGGLLAFRAQRAGSKDRDCGIRAYPVVVVGHISAIGLRAGEVWIGEGFYFGRDSDKRGSFPTLNFAKSDIRGTFKIGAYHDYQVRDPARPTGPARVHGDICVVAANVGKNFELLGLGYAGMKQILGLDFAFFDWFGVDRDEAPYVKLTAQGLKVDRRVYIAHASFCDAAPITSDDSRPPNSAPAAIDLWKSTIGTGFRIDHHCRCVGALRLNSCVIGREVVVGCATIDPSKADFAAADFKPGDIPLLVDIGESTVNGRVRIGRHEPRTTSEKDAIKVAGAISFQSTNVQGGILLGHLTFDLGAYGPVAKEQAARNPTPSRTALDLRDCSCGADLEIHSLSWTPPGPAARRKAVARQPLGPGAWIPSRHKPRFQAIDRGLLVEIDMRGLQCGMLIDGFGDEWSLVHGLRIRLAGIRIGEVEPAAHDPPHAGPKRHRPGGPARRLPRRPHLARLRWLAFQNRIQEAVDPAPSRPQGAARTGGAQALRWTPLQWWARAWDRFWRRHYCSLDDDFVPQAYHAFSSAYRRSGEDSTAEAILVERKNIQNALRFQRIRETWRRAVWGTRNRLPDEGASAATPPAAPRSKPVAFALRLLTTWWPWLLLFGFLAWALTVKLKIHPPSSAMAISGIILLILFWPYMIAAFQLVFRWGFRYGLSPNAALVVFFLCIGLGWGGVHVARNGGLPVKTFDDPGSSSELPSAVALVLDVDYEPVSDPPPSPEPPDDPPTEPPCDDPAPGARPMTGGAEAKASPPAPSSAVMRETGHALHVRASPCNLDVNSLLYAVDIFLPLIDLDQERRCTIREVAAVQRGKEQHDDYAGWRLAKALYELLGWIITSLVILTITGVLRRDLER